MIRLSRLADYGIVLTIQVARHADRHWNAPELASATGIPLPTTSKLLKMLVRAGILTSHRGARGGYGLAADAGRVTVTKVVEAVDGPIAITSCLDPNSPDCGLDAFCPTRTNWHSINQAIRVALDAVSIAEMARAVPPAFLRDDERQLDPHATGAAPPSLPA